MSLGEEEHELQGKPAKAKNILHHQECYLGKNKAAGESKETNQFNLKIRALKTHPTTTYLRKNL